MEKKVNYTKMSFFYNTKYSNWNHF